MHRLPHTCSVTCKQVWTNHEGTEPIWFNNVESPGVGYPRGWEDQKKWKGGWKPRRLRARLVPRQGGRVASLAVFANPTADHEKVLRAVDVQYDKLLQAPANSRVPTARAKSRIWASTS